MPADCASCIPTRAFSNKLLAIVCEQHHQSSFMEKNGIFCEKGKQQNNDGKEILRMLTIL